MVRAIVALLAAFAACGGAARNKVAWPDAPVEPLDGLARISGNEARAPRVDVRNRSNQAVRYLEIGWIVRDQQGREFMAASMPAERR